MFRIETPVVNRITRFIRKDRRKWFFVKSGSGSY